MNLYDALKAYWVADSALVALVPAERIFVGSIPSGKTYPVVGISAPAGPNRMGGTSKQIFSEEVVEITVRDSNFARAKSISDTIDLTINESTEITIDNYRIVILQPSTRGLLTESGLTSAFNQYSVTQSRTKGI